MYNEWMTITIQWAMAYIVTLITINNNIQEMIFYDFICIFTSFTYTYRVSLKLQ
jgi:hypothetical protein